MSDESESTPFRQQWERFIRACLTGNMPAAMQYVDPSTFYAMIPGQGRLDFRELLGYFDRLRNVAARLDEHVTVQASLEGDGRLAVRYYMSFRLKLEDRLVELTSSDWVEFDPDGRIIALLVFYDRMATTEQALGDIFPQS